MKKPQRCEDCAILANALNAVLACIKEGVIAVRRDREPLVNARAVLNEYHRKYPGAS